MNFTESQRQERFKHIEGLILGYQGQINAKEIACLQAPPEEKARIAQSITSLKEEMNTYKIEYNSLKENNQNILEEKLKLIIPGSSDLSLYVEKEEDQRAIDLIKHEQGITLVITGSRKVGKTFLMVKVLDAAREIKKHVIFIDLQQLNPTRMTFEDEFYHWFCFQITEALKLEDFTARHWSKAGKLTHSQSCTQYIQNYILGKIEKPLVIAIDELEMLAGTNFGVNFLKMICSWEDERKRSHLMKRLDLVLVGSTESSISLSNNWLEVLNKHRSIEVSYFTKQESQKLNRLYSLPLTELEVERLYELVGGHPYLMREAIYQIAKGWIDVSQLLNTETIADGIFGEFLRSYYELLEYHPELLEGMKKIVFGKGKEVFVRISRKLGELGLIQWQAEIPLPRCNLYRLFFIKFLSR